MSLQDFSNSVINTVSFKIIKVNDCIYVFLLIYSNKSKTNFVIFVMQNVHGLIRVTFLTSKQLSNKLYSVVATPYSVWLRNGEQFFVPFEIFGLDPQVF